MARLGPGWRLFLVGSHCGLPWAPLMPAEKAQALEIPGAWASKESMANHPVLDLDLFPLSPRVRDVALDSPGPYSSARPATSNPQSPG